MSILAFLTSNEVLGLALLKTTWFRTLLTALAAAAFTQWLNNSLTKERERENKLKETFKVFYDKVIPEIQDFFTIETDMRKGSSLKSDVDVREIRERILETISNNMIYINSEIHEAYRKVITNKYYDCEDGFSHDADDITLFYVVVEEYIKLSEKHAYKDNKSDIKNACLLLIWKNVVINCYGYDMAYAAISKRHEFDSEKLNKETLERLKNLEREEVDSNERNRLFREILNDLIANSNMNTKEREKFLKEFFDYNIEVNDSDAISKLGNLDLNPGEITVEFRGMYRKKVLSNLYKSKYNIEINDFSYNGFIYTKQEFSELHNELKNAFNYWKEKGALRIEDENETVKLIITAIGEDYYEENVYPF
ncbi:hypothetical protein [Priestia megaterium]|uniref:hypothetical protein n=1 Tax=Priestia megaterium TaxID=1404 RepID=UPI0021D69635|nr:hypothetical protein [Priestia megaterium]MCU7766483.1 hypothetical protein [Priestia megaterium]